MSEFQLRSVAVAAYAPATLFGLAEGSMVPVIILSAYDRGASTPVAALVGSLLGIGSIVTNIPSGILATRIGERRSMLVAAAITVAGLVCCLVNLGHGGGHRRPHLLPSGQGHGPPRTPLGRRPLRDHPGRLLHPHAPHPRALTLGITAMIMGFGNGIGSGIVMTLGADISPSIGRPTFLGLWRELADAGSGIGPVILSAVTALAGLGTGLIVSGTIGFAAAAALWAWIPQHPQVTAGKPSQRASPHDSPAQAEQTTEG